MVRAMARIEQAKASTARRSRPLARGLGVLFVLAWLIALVWLGVVLVRLKAAGPDALRVPGANSSAGTPAADGAP